MIGSKKHIYIWEHAGKKTNDENKNNIFFIGKTLWQRSTKNGLTQWIQFLFPLNSGRWFAGNVIDHPVNSFDFINDTIRNFS